MADHLIDIGQVIVQGVMFDPKNTEAWRNMDLVQNIYKSVPRLFDLLDERGIDYALVGGIAMLAYVDGRNTQDIDLIVDAKDLDQLPEIRIEDRSSDRARGWLGDVRVDFLFTKSKLFETVRRNFTTTKQLADRGVKCATPEGLLMVKLYALPDKYRRAHFDKVRQYEKDVADLFEQFRPRMDSIYQELLKHMLPRDVDEIRRIVADIEERLARQSTRFGPAAG